MKNTNNTIIRFLALCLLISLFCVSITSAANCGDGKVKGNEDCDGGDCCNADCTFKDAQTECRVSQGQCDITETCTGSSATCPVDVKSTAVCRGAVSDCDKAEVCGGQSNDCPVDAFKPLGTLCPDGLYCNGDETCDGNGICQAGISVTCSGKDIIGISQCYWNPDDNPFTWDYRTAFTSQCDEGTDSCTTGDETIAHTCDMSQCGATCETNEDCPTVLCADLSGCYDGKYRVYDDVPNTCTDSCGCTSNTCDNAYTLTGTDVDQDNVDAQCGDNCDNDPGKTEPGVCGCGVADTDSDGDGTPDCNDVDGEGDEGAVCGDGTCDSEESCSSCEADCGVCPITQNPPSGDSGSSGGGGGGGGGTKIRIETEIICEEISRTCTDWSKCTSNEIQSRSCQITKNCENQIQTKMEWEEQKCVYEGLEEKTLTEETQVQEGYSEESKNTKSSPTGAAITETAFGLTEKKLLLFPVVIVLTGLLILGKKTNMHIRTYRKIKFKLRKMMPCMF